MKLPEDVMLEILSRLPVKSMIRFKTVCKTWNVLVNNPMFVSKHYRNFSCRSGPNISLVARRENFTNKRVISLLKNDEKCSYSPTLVDQDVPMFLNDMFGHVRLIGPCNGTICLYGYTDNIALWNPSIRDFKTLPQSCVPRPPNAKIRGGDLGIGFDPTTSDLKVMQILFCIIPDGRLVYQVEIYSSRTNMWRQYQATFPGNIMYYNLWSAMYRDETFCWWAQDNESNNEIIVSFDMSKEVFGKTPLPSDVQGLGGQHRTTRAILTLKESIALLVYNLKDLDKVFDMWIVSELGCDNRYGGWIRLPSVGPIYSVTRPLGFWNNGELLVLESDRGEMVVYKIGSQEIRNFGIYGKRDRLEMIVYKESLFSISRACGK